MLEPAVDGLGGAVGDAGVVEVGQDVLAPAFQGSPEAGDLLDPGWHPRGDGSDQGAHEASAVGLVGVLVGVDHLLVDRPDDLHGGVALVGEQPGQPGPLPLGEQALPGQQGAASRVQRVGHAGDGLLDAPAGLIEGVGGQAHHVEGVHDRPRAGQLLGCGGLVSR